MAKTETHDGTVGQAKLIYAQEGPEPPFNSVNICQLTLPNREDFPSLISKACSVISVTSLVPLQLGKPIAQFRLGHPGDFTAAMQMPKAAV